MTDVTLNQFLSSGTHTQRLAFTPNPGTPPSGNKPSYFWIETDTGNSFAWDFTGAAWIQITAAAVLNLATALAMTGTPVVLSVGLLGMPQNPQNANYTTVMADTAHHLYHTSATPHTWTIDSNANVAYPIGTVLGFVNETGAGAITLAITSDTLAWGALTGTRTLAANGTCTALKVSATRWRLTGDGLT